jgi:cytoskeletal protein RodZ
LARPNHSFLWQTGHTTSGLALRAGRIVLVIGIGLLGLSTGEAVAQGPEPAPVSTRPQLRPEPVPVPSKPVSRPRSDEKSSPTSRTSQRTSREPQAPSTTQSAGTVRPRISSTQPTHSARPSSPRTPTKPVPANQRATGERATTRNALAATAPSDSESSNLLLIGGLVLVALALGETIFLALSIRVLRSPAGH